MPGLPNSPHRRKRTLVTRKTIVGGILSRIFLVSEQRRALNRWAQPAISGFTCPRFTLDGAESEKRFERFEGECRMELAIYPALAWCKN